MQRALPRIQAQAESSPTHPSSGRELSHGSKLMQRALPRIQAQAESSPTASKLRQRALPRLQAQAESSPTHPSSCIELSHASKLRQRALPRRRAAFRHFAGTNIKFFCSSFGVKTFSIVNFQQGQLKIY